MNLTTTATKRTAPARWAAIALLVLASATMAWAEPALTLTGDTIWVVADNEPEALERALRDVQVDWYKVLGRPPIILERIPEHHTGPVVVLGLEGQTIRSLAPATFPGVESFHVGVRSLADRGHENVSAVYATGADLRGAIYGVYAFSEAILGVDPWYFWTDHEPRYRRDA